MRTWTRTPRKTDVDVICYKVLIKKGLNSGKRAYYQSPIANMKYQLMENVPEVLLSPKLNFTMDVYRGLYVVTDGYHTFKDIESAQKMLNLFSTSNFYGLCIVECKIPAGSTYVHGNCMLFKRSGSEKYYISLKSLASSNIQLIRVIEEI